MAQRSLSSLAAGLSLRILLLFDVIYIAVQISNSSFSLYLALALWGSIVFGAIGKKTDYVIIAGIFLFGLWDYAGTDNVTTDMYLGLIAVTLAGNAIGLGLRLVRQYFFKNSWIVS